MTGYSISPHTLVTWLMVVTDHTGEVLDWWWYLITQVIYMTDDGNWSHRWVTRLMMVTDQTGELHNRWRKLITQVSYMSDNVNWSCSGNGDSSVVRAPDSWSKGPGFDHRSLGCLWIRGAMSLLGFRSFFHLVDDFSYWSLKQWEQSVLY